VCETFPELKSALDCLGVDLALQIIHGLLHLLLNIIDSRHIARYGSIDVFLLGFIGQGLPALIPKMIHSREKSREKREGSSRERE